MKQTPGYYANMMNQFIHEHNTFEDERGSFTPIQCNAFDQHSIPTIKKEVGKYLGSNDLVVTSDKDS